MRKKSLIGLVVLILALVLTVPVLADGIVTIGAGARTVTGQNVDFGSHPASFVEILTGLIGSASPWNVTDSSGALAAWDVFIATTDFVNGGSSFPVTAALDTVRVNNPSGSIVCIGGDCNPLYLPISTALNGPLSVLDNVAPLRILRSDVSLIQNGSWNFEPTFNLRIPPGLPEGTYTATWTVTISDTP